MKHRRRRPKHQRAGCLMCKPWKDERVTKNAAPGGDERRDRASRADLREARARR